MRDQKVQTQKIQKMDFNEILRQNIDSIPIIEDYKYSMTVGKTKKGKFKIVVYEGDDIKFNANLNKESSFIKYVNSAYKYYKSMGIRVKKLNNIIYLFEKYGEELSGIKEHPRKIKF